MRLSTNPRTGSPTERHHARPVIQETLTTKSLQFAIGDLQSCMDLRDPDALTLDYTQLMMGFLLFQAQPRTIAMIGLGGGSLAKYCHRNLPSTTITVIEINPHVLAMREAFCIPPDSDRFRVLMGDGAEYVRRPIPAPDVLMIDGYDVKGLPADLGSQRFYDDCYQWLERGGLMVANLHLSSKAYPQFVERIQRGFQGNVRVVPEQYGSNCIVFARKGGAHNWPTPHSLHRPPDFETFAWRDLQPALDHIRKVISQHSVDATTVGAAVSQTPAPP